MSYVSKNPNFTTVKVTGAATLGSANNHDTHVIDGAAVFNRDGASSTGYITNDGPANRVATNLKYNGSNDVTLTTGGVSWVDVEQTTSSSGEVFRVVRDITNYAGGATITATSTSLSHLANGNTTITGGIKLSNGAAGSSTFLANYEEGTWTPAFSAGVSVVVYATQVGSYTRIGRTVQIYGILQWTSLVTSGASLMVSGLPFTVNNNSSYFPLMTTNVANVTSGPPIAYGNPNTSNIAFVNAGGVNPTVGSQLNTGGGYIYFNGTYAI